MTYLSVDNFWKYQNADVWKKAKGHPPWFKHWVHRDRDLDALPIEARLLWFELLAAATRYENVLCGQGQPVDRTGLSESEADLKQSRSDSEANLKWIWAETRIEPEVVAEMLPLLVKGGWLSETKTPRRSRKVSRKIRDNSLESKEEEVEEEKRSLRVRANDKSAMFVLRTMVANGALLDEDQLAVEVRDRRLTDLQHRELLTALRARRLSA